MEDRKGTSIIPSLKNHSSQGKKRSEKILRKRNLDSYALPFESQESSYESDSKNVKKSRDSDE